MAAKFDPYYKWLGIPPNLQPPNHYQLLGLRDGEPDPDVIAHAADRQMAHVRTFQSGRYSSFSQKLLNEISGARVVLLNADKKQVYDSQIAGTAVDETGPLDSQPTAPDFPGIRTRRRRSSIRRKRPLILQPMVWILFATVWLVALFSILYIKSIRRAESAAKPEPQESAARRPVRQRTSPLDGKRKGAMEQPATGSETPRLPPTPPARTDLEFTFTDQAHCETYWEWNDAWEFKPDGAHVGRGPASRLRSRNTFFGDVKIEMDFSYGQAKFSNTGGAWVVVWGQRIPIYNAWHAATITISIHREANEVVYLFNGKEGRLPIDESLVAAPTTIELIWRSRTAHFRRAEISALRVEPILGASPQ